ncbi:uncharacterized protein Sptz isoform X2 [Anoplolepis gracilipes]|uniref:uncharacterized protein Sptz isoform X2 n=1 Tax=Anoplolepis gracilipes TaxID=354296 RepID=UPI003B9EC603
MHHIKPLKEIMSKQTGILELDKCVLSQLWYTSLNIFQTNNDNHFSKEFYYNCIDLTELKAIVENLIHSANKEQYEWIAYILLWKVMNNKSSNINCDIQCNIQIQLDYIQIKNAIELIHQCDNTSDYPSKEFMIFFQDANIEHNVKEISNISKQIFTFLKEKIHFNSGIVCWIIKKLISVVPITCSIVDNLQDIYFFTLKSCLEHIPVRKNWHLSHKMFGSYYPEADSAIYGNFLKIILCILSKMDMDKKAEIEFLKIVYSTLSKAYHVKDIELVLYSKKNDKPFKEWLLLWNETHAYSENVTTLFVAYKISESIFKLTKNFKILLCEQELLKRISAKKSHWLNDILDICYILTMKRKYGEVELLLSCDLLKKLYPVLLVKTLNNPQEEINSPENYDNGIFICESIKFFLKRCYPDLHSDNDLNELHMILKTYIETVKYILHWKKEYLTRLNIKDFQNLQSDIIIEHIISVQQILALLQKHNVLSVLKITTNIHDQDHTAINNLLEKSDQSETFQAYCCIISALKAILFCEFYNTEHKQVTKYFTDMMSYLSSLFPLRLRIQTIENIFSLLFLRYENFNVTNFKDDYCNISLERMDFVKSVEYEKSGFLTNKYIIRDMLHYLWNSTLVVTQEIDKLQTLGLHEEAQQLRENIFSLTSTLMDARWKLTFYTKSHFIVNIGISQDESDNLIVTNKLEPVMYEKLNFPHHIKEDTFFYKEDSTSDETKIKSDSSSESGLLGGNKRRKRSRITTATADILITKKEPSFINLMLASKESLVLHCLWRSDFQKAREIVEMFHIENTQVDGEIRFSEAFYTFKQDISKYVHSSDTIDSSKKNSGTSTLENIRLITQEAVQSSKHVKQLETFLASQELHLRMLNMDILNSKKILTFSVLDLSLTISKTYQISNNLCDVAMKYLKSYETFDDVEYAYFFLKIYQLFYDSKNNMSVTNILCDTRIPLYVKKWKERNDIWSDFGNNYRSFRNLKRTGIVAMQHRDNNNCVLGLKTMRKMFDIFNSDKKYFQNIYSYLQLVCTIIPDIADANIVTVFDLLKTSLYCYFGYQIFDLKIEPDELETVASNLQVNLIYSILVNACPKVSYCNENIYTHYNNVKDSGSIILNQKREDSNVKNVTEPNQCIAEILTELLQVLHDVSPVRFRLDNSCLRNISNHTAVRAVLNKTSSLANLDLSELSVGNETLTFFLNVWNVMFLHANLDVWSNDPPVDDLRRTVSLMSIGYMIGDLGLVTLAALRSKLLGYHASDLEFFMAVEELNKLAWQDLDLIQNPRVIFAMANEFYDTPEIRVYETDKLDENLNDAMCDYVSHYLSAMSFDDDDDFTNNPMIRRKISFTNVIQNVFTQNAADISVNRNLSLIDGFEILNENINYIACNYTYEVVLRYSEHDISRVRTTNTMEPSFWQIRMLRPSLLRYLERHCWLLSYLVQKMQNENLTILENDYDNIKCTICLENLLNSPWVDKLKILFDNNQTLTAIHDGISVHELWHYFEQKEEDRNMQNSLEILNALADSVIKYNMELQRFKDLILTHILSNFDVPSDTKMLEYLYQIKDIHILVQITLHNVNKWPMNVCEYALHHALQHEHSYKLPAYCKRRINGILHRITIFHRMIPYCESRSNSTWYDIMYCTKKINSFEIIKSLIYADQFELCLEWLECQAFSFKIQSLMIQDFFIGLLKNKQQDFQQALKFLQTLPPSQSVKMCKGILKKLESINALQFVTNYLLEHCRVADQSKYKKILISLEILKMLENKDKTLYIHLIKEPLLMLEQLLMNCKIESIQKILNTLHGNLQHADVDIGNFDKIIRFYARKSLDFRVSIQRDGIESKAKNIPQSNLEADNNEFVMPINVPTKEEWIPNDKARECSCCKAVIFSMFNRRHHCRRCGRVVCAMCSQHRMQVAGYPNSMFVRVCDNCKCQTILQMHAMQNVSTANSETFEGWRLTRDERHNRTIREEFSFEYAPNISLCLTILNLHSDHKMYTSFLLDRCDEMKQLLQPVSGGRINPEVDHAVIIKMIRSLLVAAKVKCAKLGFNTGLTHCDRFLSQVDLIATLVQSDCLTLISTDDLDEHTLRKLRDLLSEKEQWILALDVSTKAGLDTQGVWAAWGKACLKVGHWDQAREKFHHCFDKIVYEDFDDWVVLSYSKESEKCKGELMESNTTAPKRNNFLNEEKGTNERVDCWKRKEYSKYRPIKDPPLLTELLQILDNLSAHRFRIQQSFQSISNAMQEIFHILNNLKALSQNQFNTKYLTPVNLTVYYQESLYYLLTYGSHNSILQFFLKYKEFDKCLVYILENDLECDLFLNGVYLYCLKSGDTDKLHDAMKVKDPTLFIWKKYLIFVCHFMERKQYWHILYQIQLFMKDCIRASMTCIYFYTNEVNSYLDLYNRVHLLQDAQKHLESELQIENLSKKRKSTSFAHSSQNILTMEMEPSEIDRHINTICRQMEITKFLANCEKEDRIPTEFLNLFPNINSDESQTFELPTLFGNQQQKIHLAVLAILCGRDIEEGFGIAFRIIQDYNLPQQKIYSLAAHVLTLKNDIAAIEQLIKCCRSSGAPNAHVISDHVLTYCIKLLSNCLHTEQNPALKNIDILIKLIIDTKLKNTYTVLYVCTYIHFIQL